MQQHLFLFTQPQIYKQTFALLNEISQKVPKMFPYLKNSQLYIYYLYTIGRQLPFVRRTMKQYSNELLASPSMWRPDALFVNDRRNACLPDETRYQPDTLVNDTIVVLAYGNYCMGIPLVYRYKAKDET